MPDTTLEEARRCPSCQEPGQSAGTRLAPERHMGKLHMFICNNERCKKTGLPWIVQIRPDGTIPEPTLNREKNFPIDSGTTRSRIEKARASADANLGNSMRD